ncbi:D-alanine--D-alanine ligase family protein [Sphaerochaeta sp.]|uniref:D-alanine--D-alanine ligase family protein n=1 Tax=Sphaerochaeta sp. TaxID=1972642 RepID=UPI002FC6746B
MQVALVYGGRSTEHEVSVSSARAMLTTLREAGHTTLIIGISLEGIWYLQHDCVNFPVDKTRPLYLKPGEGVFLDEKKLNIEVVFATTHGHGGEDGNLQGLCLLCNLALCGCDTVSSALGMYKALAAAVFQANHIPTVPTVLITEVNRKDLNDAFFADLVSRLGPHLFIKPEDGGSSVGVHSLRNADLNRFREAVKTAFQYSERVLVQTMVDPMVEVECAALHLEDGNLVIAGPGRVIDPAREEAGFLSYAHKYGPINTAHIQIPSGLDATIEEAIRSYARAAFAAIKADGYARIDFFVSNSDIYLNEINTFPGMTATSHFPALMASQGYDMVTVVNHLISDAQTRFRHERNRIYLPPKE